MDRLLRSLARTGFTRGLRGDNPVWLVLAVAVWLIRRARRSRPDVVFSGVLVPGERMIISAHDPGSPATAFER
jgi:hypothetical protein